MKERKYLSIKEFSKLSGIEPTTLRYWDEIGIFSPAMRDPDNNYRYYAAEQIIAVNFISVLSSLRIPLKSIQDIAQTRTPERIISLIERQERQLDKEMRRLQEEYSIIHTRLQLINYGIRVLEGYEAVEGIRDHYNPEGKRELIDKDSISVLYREERACILGPENQYNGEEDFYEPFIHFCRSAEELRINLGYPVGGFHQDFASFVEAPGSPDRFFSMDPSGNYTRKEGNYLVGFCSGYYGDLGTLAKRMSLYAAANKLQPSGPVFTMYLHDEVCLPDADSYLAQISVAVR